MYMKNNTLQKKQDSDRFIKSGSVCSFCLLAGLLSVQNGHAQFYNEGDVFVKKETVMSVYEDYKNDASGSFTNNGLVYIYKNWTNDGVVDFTAAEDGKTFFNGEQIQKIEGSAIANFQNIIFDNLSDLTPFQLATSIAVNKNSDFHNGIIDADTYNGKMIFNENALHTNTSDVSFVDGKVQKLGKGKFEFPVGDELHFRPSYNNADAEQGRPYTTQYFYKNSEGIHSNSNKVISHSIKEETIQVINNAEYWNVTNDDNGNEKIILSLSMDRSTTPGNFFTVSDNKQIVIVRWDEISGKWVSEGGVVSDKPSEPDASAGAQYEQLVTARVRGYGIFTLAIADKVNPDNNDELIVYNGISPNDDGKNDSFLIKGIAKYPDNEVEIYNRWGVKVYDAKGYNESDKMFRGYSDGRATMNRGEKLPTGTYFYILKYNNGKKGIEKSGYLYISNQ
jgi:gliding motility-associated-like protein